MWGTVVVVMREGKIRGHGSDDHEKVGGGGDGGRRRDKVRLLLQNPAFMCKNEVWKDRLSYDRPSKAVDWLINKAKNAIAKLDEQPE
ncbi:hypothetical protein RJ639_019108 [Escallonia herrerae]|uniref:TCP domain-containing protein n=1 Tax=Escallonia herrerae TaxID=1293975 RepID=A0AA88V9T6_9ASTE|nr:hypothetical protein RJ639_019108 [Escallonia herrerae]